MRHREHLVLGGRKGLRVALGELGRRRLAGLLVPDARVGVAEEPLVFLVVGPVGLVTHQEDVASEGHNADYVARDVIGWDAEGACGDELVGCVDFPFWDEWEVVE